MHITLAMLSSRYHALHTFLTTNSYKACLYTFFIQPLTRTLIWSTPLNLSVLPSTSPSDKFSLNFFTPHTFSALFNKTSLKFFHSPSMFLSSPCLCTDQCSSHLFLNSPLYYLFFSLSNLNNVRTSSSRTGGDPHTSPSPYQLPGDDPTEKRCKPLTTSHSLALS